MVPRDDDFERVRDLVERIDPSLVQAMDEIDVALLRWGLSLSPWERLRASSSALGLLSGFHRVTPTTR